MSSDLKPEDKAVQNEADQTTAQPSSPAGEAPTTKEETPKEVPAEASDNLPEDDAEKRRAFQQMRQEIKQLKEETRARKQHESAFAQFRQQVAPSANLYQGVRVEDYTDPLTGEMNRPAYNAAIQASAAQQAALMAQQSVQDQLDEHGARQRHPELFSDPEIEEEIAAKWLWHKTQGQSVSISDVADRIAKRFAKAVSKAEKSGAEKALGELTPKEQAALSPTSQTSAPTRQAQSEEDYEKARLASRGVKIGSDGSFVRITDEDSTLTVAQRMKSIPWANK